MNRLRTLVPYSNDSDKKKLEDYIKEKIGKHIDLGPIGYDGKPTIQTLDADLTHIDRTNITCAYAFPGIHFKNVDQFLEWHKQISEMHYLESAKEAEKENGIVALYYHAKTEEISFICFHVNDRQDIEQYHAISFETKYARYRLLTSDVNGDMIMFRQTGGEDRSFMDIRPIDRDLEFFRNQISTNSKGYQ